MILKILKKVLGPPLERWRRGRAMPLARELHNQPKPLVQAIGKVLYETLSGVASSEELPEMAHIEERRVLLSIYLTRLKSLTMALTASGQPGSGKRGPAERVT